VWASFSYGTALPVIGVRVVDRTAARGNCATSTLRLEGAGSSPTGSRTHVGPYLRRTHVGHIFVEPTWVTCSSSPPGRMFVVSHGKTLRVISRHAVDATVPLLGNCETSTPRFEGQFDVDSLANSRGLHVIEPTWGCSSCRTARRCA
jgi:hypothetical protein